MYKLVAVGGKLRGEEFAISSESSYTVGRDSSCDFVLESRGISSQHFTITLRRGDLYLEDLGSSNGTLVNEKYFKSGTVDQGDLISLPNVTLKVVKVNHRKIIVPKAPSVDNDNLDFGEQEKIPDDFLGKVLYVFRTKIMTIIYDFNKSHEWKYMVAFFIFILSAAVIYFSIRPVQKNNRLILMNEMVKRVNHYTDMIARMNSKALELGNIDQIDAGFLNKAEGVRKYELFDMEGRIVRPVESLDRATNDPFSILALRAMQKSERTVLTKLLSDSEIGVAKTIESFNIKKGIKENVGIIAIRFSPASLVRESVRSWQEYLEALVVSFLFVILIFGMIYYLTTNGLREFVYKIKLVNRGKESRVELDSNFEELEELVVEVNSLLLKIKESSGDNEFDFETVEDDGKYVAIHSEIAEGIAGPTLVLNSSKLIMKINSEGEDLLGVRESIAKETDLVDTLRDQGLVATIIAICEESSELEGVNSLQSYDISGVEYNIHATTLMGKDNYAKSYLILFRKEL